MKMVALTLVLAVATGYAAGGRLGRLAAVELRWPALGLVGIALQLPPAQGTAGNVLVALSFVTLLTFAVLNVRKPGFVLVLVGLAMNFLVIGINHGMPVSTAALIASDQRDALGDLAEGGGAKHHAATAEDEMRFLGDVIPIPSPVRQAVSAGDVVMYIGAGWFVVAMMRRREEAGSERGAPIMETPA